MHFSRDGKFVRTDIWREGKYLDLWSVPHFLSGLMVALAAYFVGFEPIPTFIIAFLLFTAYEMFEVIAKIEETRVNRILDIVVGMASFTPTYFLAPMFPEADLLAALIVVSVVDGILSFFGWRASQKALVLEQTLRAEFEEKKRKLEEGGAIIRKKLHESRLKWGKRGRNFGHRHRGRITSAHS